MERSFYYTIKEIPDIEPVKFNYSNSVLDSDYCIEYLCERSAFLHFMGNGGWKCEHGWPLTFSVYSSKMIKLGTCTIFVLDGNTPPTFDTIRIKTK